MGAAACPAPLGRQGLQECTDPQHQSYPAAWQYVAGGNGEVKDVLTPSFLSLDPCPEDEKNTLVSEEIFQRAEEKYHYSITLTVSQLHLSWLFFKCPAPLPLTLLHPWGSWPWTGLRVGALSHHLLGK